MDAMNSVRAHHSYVKDSADEHGYKYVLMTVLVGSQNYNLDTPNSDVDTYFFVLPSYFDIITNKPLVSLELTLSDNSKAYVKDIRLAFNLLRKSSPNSIEYFLSKYKVYDNPAFEMVFENTFYSPEEVYYLTHANFQNMINAIVGTIKGLHGRNMTEGKKHAHALRLYDLMLKYTDAEVSPENYLVPQGELLNFAKKAKFGEFSPEGNIEGYNKILAAAEEYANSFSVTPKEKEVEYLADWTINRLQEKVFEIYFELEGWIKKSCVLN